MACKLSDLADRSEQSYMDDKRGASQDEFVLERVQGLTSTTLHSLASNPVTGWVAFPAACVLVLLDPKTNEQKFIESPSLRNISCCAFTDDGRFVAFGETGMKPHIAMWNLREHKECHKFVIDTTVRAIFFHPTSPIIISLGLKESVIVVWDYIKGMRMASCKWQTMPLSVTIPRSGSSLMVCGHRKITLFNISKVDSYSHETNVFQDRKTVLLGKQSEYTFVDVESGRGKHERIVYTVTSCGYLCEIKLGDILIDKAIKVDTQTFCVRYNTELLFVGCTAGVVKICDPDNLTVTAAVSLSNLLGPSAMPKVGNKCYLDVCTLVVDENEKVVTCVYADCSMHSWQIGTDGQKIVCSAIEPGVGSNGVSGHPASKSNLLRSFIGCCETAKNCNECLPKCSVIEQNKPPQQFCGRRLVNENRASYQNVNAVRFTPDGKDVICGNEEGEIKVYELSTGILRRVIEAHSSQVTCIELMYDNDFQLVCSGGRDRVMFVLNARNDFSLVQVLCDHSAAITAISLVNHKGVLTLISAAADNVVLIRRAILGGTLRFTITGEIAQTNCNRSFFVTSDYIALGGKDSQIKVFKADPVFVSKPVKTINCQKLSPSNAGFKAIDIDPSNSFMAVSQSNGNISVYHLQTGQPVASLPLQSDITSIQFTSDLKYMVSSTSNGCDLVWRLPERMTEFMQSKQDKIYQIETNKEVTSETYVSCVKVCKEEVEEEDDASCDKVTKENDEEEESPNQQSQGLHQGMRRVFHHQRRSSSSRRNRGKNNPTVPDPGEKSFNQRHIGQNSSNHNSEWDRTPSIDSMSILDHRGSPMMFSEKSKEEREGEDGRSCSSCCSESILNCSTCTQSVSTSTHTSCCSAGPTESSTSSQHGHAEQHTEQHTEHSRHLRFYCGTNHELYDQVIDEGHCVKLGPFKEDSPAEKVALNTETYQQVARSMSLRDTTHEGKIDTLDAADSIAPLKEGTRGFGTGEQAEKYDKSKNGVVLETARTEIEHLVTEQSFAEKIATQHGDAPMMETETNKRLDQLDTGIDLREHHELSNLTAETPHDVSQNFTASPTYEPRYPRSKKILEKALFYEGVMKGDLKSTRLASPSSPTRQYTAAVGEAVRFVSQQRPEVLRDLSAEEEAAKKNYSREGNAEVDDALHWTPLTTPDYSNTSSNITNLVPSSSSTLIDLCNSSKLLKDMEVPPSRDKNSLGRLGKEQASSPTLFDVDNPTPHPDTVKNFDCDTTQEDGESFRSDLGDEMVSAVYHLETTGEVIESCNQKASDAAKTVGVDYDTENDNKILDLSINLGNINLNSEVENTDKGIMVKTSAIDKPNENTSSEIPICLNSFAKPEHSASDMKTNHQNTVKAYLSSGHAKEMVLGQEEDDVVGRQSVLDQLEQEGFTVPEKYRSALRSCMQLSNSQETFATLRVDTNDLELMAFLSHALKKKLVAAGLVGLSCNEIDSLLNTSVHSTEARAVPAEADTAKNCGAQEQATRLSDNIEQTNPTKKSQPRLEDPHEEMCGVGDQANVTNVLSRCETSPLEEGSCKLGEKCCGDQELSAQNRPDSVTWRRNKTPLGESKRNMLKSIVRKLSCATTSNKNRSNTESQMESSFESKIRSMIQASARGEEFNDLTHSDTYLKVESSEEKLDLPTAEGAPQNSMLCAKSAECFCDVRSNTSPGLPIHVSDRQSSNVQTLAGKSTEPACSESCLHKIRTKGHNQGGTSPRHDSVRVTSGSNSSPRTAACRERVSEELQLSAEREKRPTFSQTQWTLPAACSGERVGEESDHSKTESFVSALSRDVCVEHGSESDSGVGVEFRREKPMVEIFRDQDEYLRKLKEVRENFERSIQALSAERKSRQAAEERGRSFPRK